MRRRGLKGMLRGWRVLWCRIFLVKTLDWEGEGFYLFLLRRWQRNQGRTRKSARIRERGIFVMMIVSRDGWMGDADVKRNQSHSNTSPWNM